MKYLKITSTLVSLFGIVFLFNLKFTMNFTPAGSMGEISDLNVYASLAYIVFWVALSILTGFKGYKYIFIGGLIYSILPFIGLLGTLFIPSPLAIIIMFTFYLGVPVQGVGAGMVFLQLPILIIGYIIGKRIKRNGRSVENIERNI